MGILDAWPAAARQALAGVQSQLTDTAQGGSTDPMLISSNRKYLVQITQAQDIPTIGTTKDPIIVVGQVPEDFQMNQAVAWKAPWGAGLAGDGNIGDILAVTMGTRLLAQVQTIQVWQGAGNDLDFGVTLEFRAYSDVDRDVMIPLYQLMAMAQPSVNPATGWLRSPGPVLDDDAIKQIGQGAISTIADISSSATQSVSQTLTNGGSAWAAAKAGFNSVTSTAGQQLGSAKDKLDQLMKNKIEIRVGDWFRLKNAVITDVQHSLKAQQPGPTGGVMSAVATVTFRPMFTMTTVDLKDLLMTSAARLAASGSSTPTSSASFNTNALTNPLGSQ